MQNKKWRVLIVDDEFRIGRLIKKLIHWDEFALECVDVVDNGGTAFEIIQSDRCPDVVITDIRMPVMDGITLLTKVREQFPFTKFIITSGFSDFEYAKKAITLKVSDYLLKPVDSEELKEALSKIKQEFQIAGNDYEEVFNARTAAMTPTQIATLLKDFIVKNYSEDINLNLIADNMNYSPSYLTKIFCQVYGCTPSKYLITQIGRAHV